MKSSSNAMMIKAKAMFGNRLTAKDYQLLLQKKNIGEIASYLKNDTYFSRSLEGINEKAIHRGQLEILIKTDLFKRFSSLMRYEFDDKDDFYRFEIIESEITQILNVVRSFMTQDNTTLISSLPTFISKEISFDLEKLVSSKNFDDLLEVLKSTMYYPIIEKYKKNKLEDIDFIGLEHELKYLSYQEIIRLARKNFKGKELDSIKDIILTEIELENFSKIYRLKKFFNASPMQIKPLITPIYQHFSKQSLNDLIESNNAEELLKILLSSKYGNYVKDYKFDRIEQFVKKINYEISKKYMYFSTNSDVVILAYMMVSNVEIQNIIDIIEGARYSVPMEQISRLLVY